MARGDRLIPVHQHRIGLFLTGRRTEADGQWRSNSHGEVMVSGPAMTQLHARVMDALLASALEVDHSGGLIRLLVDPYRVRVAAGGRSIMSMTDLRSAIADMIRTLVSLHIPSREMSVAESGLIAARMDAVDLATGKPITVRRSIAGEGMRTEACMWVVVLGHVTSRLMREDATMTYPVRDVSRLHHSSSQALARYVLSMDRVRQPLGGWMLDTVLTQIGIPASGSARRKARAHVRGEVMALRALGVEVEGGRCRLVDGD